jgi:hypothetical protein
MAGSAAAGSSQTACSGGEADVVLGRELHALRGGAVLGHVSLEQVHGGLPGDHAVGHRVRVALVFVPGFALVVLQLDAGALLHHVRGLVGRGVQIGRLGEGDVLSVGERLGPEGLTRLGRGAPDERLGAAEVVLPEGRLDALLEGQRPSHALHARRGRLQGRGPAHGADEFLALQARGPARPRAHGVHGRAGLRRRRGVPGLVLEEFTHR